VGETKPRGIPRGRIIMYKWELIEYEGVKWINLTSDSEKWLDSQVGLCSTELVFYIKKVNQSHYRPGGAQRVPGS